MRFSPLFDKEGKGRFFAGMKWTNAATFRDRTLAPSHYFDLEAGLKSPSEVPNR